MEDLLRSLNSSNSAVRDKISDAPRRVVHKQYCGVFLFGVLTKIIIILYIEWSASLECVAAGTSKY